MCRGAIQLRKVGADDNLADELTNGVEASDIAKHIEGVRIKLRNDRHAIAPELDKRGSLEVQFDGE